MRQFRRMAFSLIEVLVVVALMSFIIIGLVTMFSQTQRAYKLGMTQVDVLEAGRAVTDMMTREFSQMAPAYQSNLNTFGAVNFEIVLHTNGPFYQTLPGMPVTVTEPGRTNLMEDVFFFTKENQRWSGIGYQILDPVTGNVPLGGIGALYRFETNAYYGQRPAELFRGYRNSRYTNGNVTKLLDGVVHFKVRAFDTNGMWLNQSVGSNISANIAVNGTSIEAMNLGYRVVVPGDGIAGDPPEYVEQLLRYTIRNLAIVTTVDQILAHWNALPAGP